jgi:hypothetical protein
MFFADCCKTADVVLRGRMFCAFSLKTREASCLSLFVSICPIKYCENMGCGYLTCGVYCLVYCVANCDGFQTPDPSFTE